MLTSVRTLLSPAGPVAPPRSLGGRTVLAVSAIVCLLVTAWYSARSGMIDLTVYVAGGGAILDANDLYTTKAPGTELPFTYPPFSAVLFAPVSLLSAGLAEVVWTFVSAAALCYVVAEGVALLGLDGRRRDAVFGAALLGAVLVEPVTATFAFGQVNTFVVALVVADACGRLPRVPRGVGIGLVAGLKLTPLIFVAYLLVAGRRRAAGTAVLTFVGTVALGFVVQWSSAWTYWTELVVDSERVGGVAYVSNQSVHGAVVRLAGSVEAASPVWLIVGAVVGAAGLLVAASASRAGHELLGVSACGLTACLVSPISWSHHYVWVVPAGLALAALLLRTRGARAAYTTLAAWFVVFAASPIWWVPYEDDREYDWTLLEGVVGSTYLIVSVGWTVAVALSVRASAPRAQSHLRPRSAPTGSS